MVSSLTGSKEAMAALGSAVADALKTQGLPAGQTSSGSFGGGQPTAAMFGHQQPGPANMLAAHAQQGLGGFSPGDHILHGTVGKIPGQAI